MIRMSHSLKKGGRRRMRKRKKSGCMGLVRMVSFLAIAFSVVALTAALPPAMAGETDLSPLDRLKQKNVRELKTLLSEHYDRNSCLDAIDVAIVLTDKIQNRRSFEWAEAKSYEGRCYYKMTGGPSRPQVKQDLLGKALATLNSANSAVSRLPQKAPVVALQVVNHAFISDIYRALALIAAPQEQVRLAGEALAAAEALIEKRPEVSRSNLAGFIAMKKGDALLDDAEKTAEPFKRNQLLRDALREYRKALLYDYGRQQPAYASWVHARLAMTLAGLCSLHSDTGYCRQSIASYKAYLEVPDRSADFWADTGTRLRIGLLWLKAWFYSLR